MTKKEKIAIKSKNEAQREKIRIKHTNLKSKIYAEETLGNQDTNEWQDYIEGDTSHIFKSPSRSQSV